MSSKLLVQENIELKSLIFPAFQAARLPAVSILSCPPGVLGRAFAQVGSVFDSLQRTICSFSLISFRVEIVSQEKPTITNSPIQYPREH